MRAAVLASARKPRNAASPRRRAKSPALHCGRKRALTRKRQPTARPVGGPMQASAPTQGTAALHDRHPPSCLPPRSRRPSALHCRAGVHARRGGLRRGNAAFLRKRRTAEPCNAAGPGRFAVIRKDTGKARRRTPQSAGADSSPSRGAFQAAVFPKPPLQGEVAAPQGADGRVHCRLAAEISRKPGRALPCVS